MANILEQGCMHPGHKVTWATKFCMVDPNICGSSVWILLHITLLVPRISRWLVDFWKICAPVVELLAFLSFFSLPCVEDGDNVYLDNTGQQSLTFFVLN